MMRYWPLIILMSVSACAHKADLKTPSQIAAEKKKADARAAKKAKEQVKEQAAPSTPDSQEVTVP